MRDGWLIYVFVVFGAVFALFCALHFHAKHWLSSKPRGFNPPRCYPMQDVMTKATREIVWF